MAMKALFLLLVVSSSVLPYVFASDNEELSNLPRKALGQENDGHDRLASARRALQQGTIICDDNNYGWVVAQSDCEDACGEFYYRLKRQPPMSDYCSVACKEICIPRKLTCEKKGKKNCDRHCSTKKIFIPKIFSFFNVDCPSYCKLKYNCP